MLSLTFDLWKKEPLADRCEKKCILALLPRLLTFVIDLALLWKHPSQNGVAKYQVRRGFSDEKRGSDNRSVFSIFKG